MNASETYLQLRSQGIDAWWIDEQQIKMHIESINWLAIENEERDRLLKKAFRDNNILVCQDSARRTTVLIGQESGVEQYIFDYGKDNPILLFEFKSRTKPQ